MSFKARILFCLFFTSCAIFLAIALFDFSPHQSHLITTDCKAEGNNLTGTLGCALAFWLLRMFGVVGFLLPGIPFFLAFSVIFPNKFSFWHIFFAGNFIVCTSILMGWFQHFYGIQPSVMLSAGPGGILGDIILKKIFLSIFGKFGSLLVVLSILLLQTTTHLILLFRKYPFLKKPFRWTYVITRFIGRKFSRVMDFKSSEKFPENQNDVNRLERTAKPCPVAKMQDDKESAQDIIPIEVPHDISLSTTRNVHVFEETSIDRVGIALKKNDPNYIFPAIDLLESSKVINNNSENCQQVARQLVDVLSQFGVNVTPGEIHKGPVITRYEVTPDTGIRVEKIVSLDKNIALGLAAKSVRIIAPVPGKSCVGVELPNKNPASVHLREILESKAWADSGASIPIVLGRGVTGEPMIYDLAKMPHLLIAGATGSGKTVCINAIIASLLYHVSPNDLRFIMVDPKIVEMQNYNKLPHMLVPVVTDPKKVPSALKWLIAEMELRYQVFAKVGARNISNYNEKIKKLPNPSEENNEYKKFPYIVCIIDELADLMMVAPGDIETYIARLAQLARAAGIHLILATQRPSVNVITGIIKANLPCRIAFKVSSKVDSRTILDMGGAEALLGQGDMLFSPPGASGLLRAQGALVSDDEINGIVDFLYKKNGGPNFEQSVQAQIENNIASENSTGDDWDDEMIPRAIEIIRANDRASTSFLQRKLKIGYNRAARIMDTLREQGLVGTEQEADL